MAHWLTTAPNPHVPGYGPDAGQRGWKLHAVDHPGETFAEMRRLPALCGLRPAHGWSLDLFIQDKCTRCVAKAAKIEGRAALSSGEGR